MSDSELSLPPCSTMTACKANVSYILLTAINGTDKSLRTDDGFIRWGLVERRIHEAISKHWPNTPLERSASGDTLGGVVGNYGISEKSLNILAADDYEEYGDDPM